MSQTDGAEDDELRDVLALAAARVDTLFDGKWRLERILGVGATAAVYAARHRNGRLAAIKVLHPHVAILPSVRRRFLREGYVANKIAHPAAVPVLDDGVTEDGEAFLVMPMLEGETLQRRWEHAGRRMAPRDALHVAVGVLDVLAVAHASGVVHRDIKPENIFLTTDGDVRVLDFGIATLRDPTASDSLATRPGTTRGTPAFMAPEQARGEPREIDGRTDIWSVGALVFTLISGEYVHVAATAQQLLYVAATQPPRSLGSVVNPPSARVVAIVDRALAFESTRRWPDAAAMQMAIESTLASGLDTDLRGARGDVNSSADTLPEHAFAPPATNTALVAQTSGTAPGSRRALRVTALALVASSTLIGLMLWQRSNPAPRAQSVSETATTQPSSATPIGDNVSASAANPPSAVAAQPAASPSEARPETARSTAEAAATKLRSPTTPRAASVPVPSAALPLAASAAPDRAPPSASTAPAPMSSDRLFERRR